ncbi:hypothetical protein NBRC3188_2657 [Acetobacter pasteurianus NBRC 3188]|uniref:Uncharacterized protein n=1 Tax=Acetobacter pasteurianus NBRC 3188 TaxID=1226663 RepID=A0A401WXM5_ACEPA|nr:hypothetical protein NBRC3188_2657 [Acetobacter pasteurianus NBRC 3188]
MSGRYPTTGRSTRSSRASKIPTVFTSSEELRKYFPKSFLRNGSLNLSGKKRIQYLPDEITVNGDYISLSNCTSLLRVPNGLDRTCSISLDGCTSLRDGVVAVLPARHRNVPEWSLEETTARKDGR